MEQRKKYRMLISLVLVLLLILGSLFYYVQVHKKKTIVSVDEYTVTVDGLINNIRSGQQKWDGLLDGVSFQDLCTGYYSAAFRELGSSYLEQVRIFQALRLEQDAALEVHIQNYALYAQYFSAYQTIGAALIAFSDAVDRGDYQVAIEQLELLLDVYETIPNVY